MISGKTGCWFAERLVSGKAGRFQERLGAGLRKGLVVSGMAGWFEERLGAGLRKGLVVSGKAGKGWERLSGFGLP